MGCRPGHSRHRSCGQRAVSFWFHFDCLPSAVASPFDVVDVARLDGAGRIVELAIVYNTVDVRPVLEAVTGRRSWRAAELARHQARERLHAPLRVGRDGEVVAAVAPAVRVALGSAHGEQWLALPIEVAKQRLQADQQVLDLKISAAATSEPSDAGRRRRRRAGRPVPR